MDYSTKKGLTSPQKIVSTKTYIEMAKERALANYSEEKKEKLLEHIGTGKSLYMYALENDLEETEVRAWLYHNDELRKEVELAQERSHLMRFEEIESLADEALTEVQRLRNEKDQHKYAQVLLNAYDLKINTRKWALSKINPRRYSEKMDITSAGKAIGGNTIIFADFHQDAPKVELEKNEEGEYETSS